MLPAQLYAQVNVDSLKQVLDRSKTDSTSIVQQLQVMENMQTTDAEPYLLIGNWALTKAQSLNNKYLIAYSNLQLGYTYLSTSVDYASASRHLTAAQELSESLYPEVWLKSLNGLAHMYLSNGQYDKAEEYNLKSIEGCKKYGFMQGVAAGYGSLATVYYEKSKGDKKTIQQAITYMRLSIETSTSIKDTARLIGGYMGISKMLSGIQQYDAALQYLSSAEQLIHTTQRAEDLSYLYYYKGDALSRKGDHNAAIENFLLGIEYSKRFDRADFESSAYKGLSATYKSTGNYKEALHYFELHKKIEDSILNKENFAKAADIQNKYQRERKDKELLQKNLDLETSANSRKRLLWFLVFSIGVVVLLVVFAIVLKRNINQRKKAFAELERKNKEIQEQALQLSSQAKLIAKFQSQMNPHFTFNALHNIYGFVINNENDKAISQIQSLAALMRKTLTNSVKDEITLAEEIEYLNKYIDFEQAALPSPIHFNIHVDDALEDAVIPPMMIQPFIENAIKHGELDKVQHPFIKVLIEKENDLMKLVIQDNGKGLSSESINMNRLSHSISIIKSRIELLFQQRSGINNEQLLSVRNSQEAQTGTTVQFYLPLNYSF